VIYDTLLVLISIN